jgi:hypothetical protein
MPVLPDTLELSYIKPFEVSFPSNTSTNNRYFIVEGGAFKSEIVGTGASLTLPGTNYYTDVVYMVSSYYRWVELVETELSFVPASFHVGSSWVAFARNQSCVTTNDVGFSSSNEIVNGPEVMLTEFDQAFCHRIKPSSYAKSVGALTRIKAGLITDPDQFQYEPQGTIRIAASFAKPRGVNNPGAPTILGDVYVRWRIRFSGRLPTLNN